MQPAKDVSADHLSLKSDCKKKTKKEPSEGSFFLQFFDCGKGELLGIFGTRTRKEHKGVVFCLKIT